MTSWLEDELFGPEDDDVSALAKTFEQTDPFAEEPDTASEFARAHTPQAVERMNREFMSHGAGEPGGDQRYDRIDPAFRELLEKNGLGRERLRAMAREAVHEEE